MMGERGLGDVKQRHQLAHADLARVLSQHVDELQADRVAEGLGDLGHAQRILALHVGVDDGLATALTGRSLLLGRQLHIHGHLYTYINNNCIRQCNTIGSWTVCASASTASGASGALRCVRRGTGPSSSSLRSM